MLRQLRRTGLRALKASGMFRLMRESGQRNSRLLIICYHGVATADEHLWRPSLYIQPEVLDQRFRLLTKGGYNVLPLGEAVQRLRTRTLPPRGVVLTFDDGAVDFYREAYPLLKSYGFPATVYQTTYYTGYQRPVFTIMCSYLLWKRRGEVIAAGTELGLTPPLDLRTAESRQAIVRNLIDLTAVHQLNGQQKDDLAHRLAQLLGVDYEDLVRRRILQLMNREEIAELSKAGMDFQLHTHRHRTPMNEQLFRKEIQDNRAVLREITGKNPVHFCYPSGVYEKEFLPWLAAEGVVSATTCDPSLATARDNPLLLPRYVDTSGQTELEFEGWLTGTIELMPHRRNGRAKGL
ncbi:MAG: polysaccharide deacetylase family protein [Acidobacteriales bacterium]|nr:polysaccharide deacetylase family protein [Terriglobales bacterium]